MKIKLAASRGYPIFVICAIAIFSPHSAAGSDFREGSLARDEPQPVYSSNPDDCWNRLFYCLFTRRVQIHVSAAFSNQGPFQAVSTGIGSFEISSRSLWRIESGDRAIEPLFPAFQTAEGPARLLSEPRYNEFQAAATAALAEREQRKPIARVLMQRDLWAAYDIIFRNRRRLERPRCEAILRTLSDLIRKLAPSSPEIENLTDNYSAGRTGLGLPDLFKGNNGWVEVESVPDRAHDRADDYRDCTRVFFKEGANGREAVALITQAFVVVRSGQIAPTPITIRVQLRQLYPSDSSVSQSVRQYEISRRALLSGSEPGGFLEYREDSPEYLPSAGNDYGFASRALDHELGHRDLPLLGTLRERCSACHRSDFSRVITLDMVGAGQTSSLLRYLDTGKDLHAVYVLKQKLQRDDWMSLIGSWL